MPEVINGTQQVLILCQYKLSLLFGSQGMKNKYQTGLTRSPDLIA